MLRASVVGRRVAARGFDFAATAAKLSSSEARAELAALKAANDEVAAEARAYTGKVEPIDFDAYRKQLSDSAVVDALEKEYKALEVPVFENSIKAESEAKLSEILAKAKSIVDVSDTRVAELTAHVTQLENNKTTRATTVDEYLARNPDVEKEILEEIANEDYLKDTQ